MKSSECKSTASHRRRYRTSLPVLALLVTGSPALVAQTQDAQPVAQQIMDLKSAMAATQAQLEQSQRQLEQMKQQLNTLELRIAQGGPSSSNQPAETAAASAPSEPDSAKDLAAAVDELREQQSMQAAQIATHDQTKVESESRYPVKITGLLLFSAFGNTHAVGLPAHGARRARVPGDERLPWSPRRQRVRSPAVWIVHGKHYPRCRDTFPR